MSEVDQERGMSAKARKVKKKQKTARPYREVEGKFGLISLSQGSASCQAK